MTRVFENDDKVPGKADSNFVDDRENTPYLSDPNQITSEKKTEMPDQVPILSTIPPTETEEFISMRTRKRNGINKYIDKEDNRSKKEDKAKQEEESKKNKTKEEWKNIWKFGGPARQKDSPSTNGSPNPKPRKKVLGRRRRRQETKVAKKNKTMEEERSGTTEKITVSKMIRMIEEKNRKEEDKLQPETEESKVKKIIRTWEEKKEDERFKN